MYVLCMYVCTYVHVYICMYTYVHTYVCMYVDAYIHVYVCMYLSIYVHYKYYIYISIYQENEQRIVMEEKKQKREEQKKLEMERKIAKGGNVSSPMEDDGNIVDRLLQEIRDGTYLRPSSRRPTVRRGTSSLKNDEIKKLQVMVEKSEETTTKKMPSVTEEEETKRMPSVTEEEETKRMPSVTEEEETKRMPSITEEEETKRMPSVTEEEETKMISSVTEEEETKMISSVTEEKQKHTILEPSLPTISITKDPTNIREPTVEELTETPATDISKSEEIPIPVDVPPTHPDDLKTPDESISNTLPNDVNESTSTVQPPDESFKQTPPTLTTASFLATPPVGEIIKEQNGGRIKTKGKKHLKKHQCNRSASDPQTHSHNIASDPIFTCKEN